MKESVFSSHLEDHVEGFRGLVQVPATGPSIQHWALADGFLDNIQAIGPLCKSVIEISYLADMKMTLHAAIAGSYDGKRPPHMYIRLYRR